MKDQISAFVDGELDEAEARWLIERLESEPELRRAWDDYHRVGDALRGHFAPDISAAVAARLVAEPFVLARRSGVPALHGAARWTLPVAASLAAVALVAWMALPWRAAPVASLALSTQQASPTPPVSVTLPPLSAPMASASRAASAGAPADAGARAHAQAEALSALGVGNYLLAHQRFSPSSAMQGVAPYVRTVSREGEER